MAKQIIKENINTTIIDAEMPLPPSKLPLSAGRRQPLIAAAQIQSKLARPQNLATGTGSCAAAAERPHTKLTSGDQNLPKYAEKYRRKQEERMKRVVEEEKKMREFRARTVPNFTAEHRKIERRMEQMVKPVTVPVTPRSLKHSMAIKEAHDKKV